MIIPSISVMFSLIICSMILLIIMSIAEGLTPCWPSLPSVGWYFLVLRGGIISNGHRPSPSAEKNLPPSEPFLAGPKCSARTARIGDGASSPEKKMIHKDFGSFFQQLLPKMVSFYHKTYKICRNAYRMNWFELHADDEVCWGVCHSW